MGKGVLVILVAPPVELARMHKAASPYLPVARGRVTQSRMVAGLEGSAALSWIDGAEDLDEAMLLLDVLRDMVNSLKWSYSQQLEREKLAVAGLGEQKGMFDE